MKIRISIVDDHFVVRQGLMKMLDEVTNSKVINDFENGEDFVNYFKNNNKIEPHIVFLDIEMPKLNGIEVCSWLKENKPHIKPIIFSLHNDSNIVENAIRQGSVAYLLKTADKEEINKTVQEVFHNNFCFNEHFSHQMFMGLLQNNTPKNNKRPELTTREKEVAILICQELSYKEITDRLSLSNRTVEEHKKNIFRKIGATKISGVVIYAQKKHWI